VRDGVLFELFATHIIGAKAFPVVEPLGSWPRLRMGVLEENVTAVYRRCIEALVESSAIVASLPANPGHAGVRVHPKEREALEASADRTSAALGDFREIIDENPNDPILLEVMAFLAELVKAIQDEAAARDSGGGPWTGFAAELLAGLAGQWSARMSNHLGAIIELAEWDLAHRE
jgi:hypothetical protein